MKIKISDIQHAGMFGFMFKLKPKEPIYIDFGAETRLGASVTMLFTFVSLRILFLDKNLEVVDEVCMKPWQLNYTPKKPAKYCVEYPIL